MPANKPPAGYQTITPSIICRDAASAIDFYTRAFGAEELSRMPGPDGKLMHAEVRIGDSRLMLTDENPAWGLKSPLSTNGNPSSLHLYVANADEAFKRAVDAGCTVQYPLEDTVWGDRYGKVVDPYGHEWGLAHRIKEMTPEEMEKAGKEWMAAQAQQQGQPA